VVPQPHPLLAQDVRVPFEFLLDLLHHALVLPERRREVDRVFLELTRHLRELVGEVVLQRGGGGEEGGSAGGVGDGGLGGGGGGKGRKGGREEGGDLVFGR